MAEWRQILDVDEIPDAQHSLASARSGRDPSRNGRGVEGREQRMVAGPSCARPRTTSERDWNRPPKRNSRRRRYRRPGIEAHPMARAANFVVGTTQSGG